MPVEIDWTPPLTEKQRNEVKRLEALRAKYKDLDRMCWYCGIDRKLGYDFVTEHMIPVSAGGPDVSWNLAIACTSCNATKSYLTLEEYRRLLQKRTGLPITFAREDLIEIEKEKRRKALLADPRWAAELRSKPRIARELEKEENDGST